MSITHVFFDIGGVLGTNGWDREQRAMAARHFELDEEFELRHQELVGDWERGQLTLDAYLESAVFFEPRRFSPAEFTGFMFAECRAFPQSIALARRLASRGRVRLATLNNESAELNGHRIAAFGLRDIFDAFLSSCWLGVRKPSPLIFTRALAIMQAEAGRVLFVDDRPQNLTPAQRLGFQTHHYTDAGALEETLASLDLLGDASAPTPPRR